MINNMPRMTITSPAIAMRPFIDRKPDGAAGIRDISDPDTGRSGINDAPQDMQFFMSGSTAEPHWGQNRKRRSPVYCILVPLPARGKNVLMIWIL
jgi:hypothetical protein